MGGTRRFAPDALAARVYNSGVPGLLPLLLVILFYVFVLSHVRTQTGFNFGWIRSGQRNCSGRRGKINGMAGAGRLCPHAVNRQVACRSLSFCKRT
jgi:hypothetical protein